MPPPPLPPPESPRSQAGKVRGGFKLRAWGLLAALLAVLAIAAAAMLATRFDTPADREFHAILRSARQQERRQQASGRTLSFLNSLPAPFSSLYRAVFGDANAYGFTTAEELARLGPAFVPKLERVLRRDSYPGVRAVAATALGLIGTDSTAAPLIHALQHDTEPSVRAAATEALDVHDDPAANAALIKALEKDPSDEVRAAVVQTLGSRSDPESDAALQRALTGDRSAVVRAQVPGQLAQGPDTRRIETLLLDAFLKDPDASVQASIATALGSRPVFTNAVPELQRALRENPSARVQSQCARALGEIPNPDSERLLVETLLRSDLETSTTVAAARALGTLAQRPGVTGADDGGKALQNIARTHPKAGVRAVAIASLEGYRNHLFPTLEEALLQDTEQSVRQQAAESLGRCGSVEQVATLVRAITQETDQAVRDAISKALTALPPDAVVPALNRALDKSTSAPVRDAVAAALAAAASTRLAPVLLGRLQDPQGIAEVRAHAARALGRLKIADAAPALIQLLQPETPPSLRVAAASALRRLGDTRAIPALMFALRSNDESLVAETASALAALQATNAVSELILRLGALQVGDAIEMSSRLPRISERPAPIALLSAIGQFGSTNAGPALMAWLDAPQEEVFKAAALALTRLRHRPAIPALERALLGKDTQRSDAAALALGAFDGDEVRDILLRALDTGYSRTRVQVVRALSEQPHPRNESALIEILARPGPRELREAAAQGLAIQGGTRAIPALTAALADRDGETRQAAAWALGHLGGPDVGPALLPLLGDRVENVQFAAAFALAEIGDTRAIPALRDALPGARSRFEVAAASALTLLGDPAGLPILATRLQVGSQWEPFVALVALFRTSDPDARELLQQARNQGSPALRALAAAILDGQGTQGLLPWIEAEDMTSRHYAAGALGLHPDAALAPALERLRWDPDEQTRIAARTALSRYRRLGLIP